MKANQPRDEWELTDEDYYNLPYRTIAQDSKYDDLEQVADIAQIRMLKYLLQNHVVGKQDTIVKQIVEKLESRCNHAI